MADTVANTVKVTVNGRELQVRAGTLLIEACRAAGIEVPSFCYYPGLSLQAACRMCLVEIEKAPKLQTACTVPVAEGMVVRTTTPQVVEARKAMLEFLLGNHPLDCPVCDKGGECELQDMVFRYGAAGSRFAEEKRHVEEQKWSPVVYFDAPRCILCYRCVRVCDEGMGVAALGVVNRGAHSEIAPNHGDHLECEECGMCIDICPVGALTSGAYRYQARPWEIEYVPTICTHCGDGCKTTLSVRNNRILRGNNRDHSGINGEFLCIKGRYAYDFVENPERLKQPLVRRDGRLVPASWDEAIGIVASRWRQILDRHATAAAPGISASIGVIGSNRTTNEENYLLQKFARTVLRTNHVDHRRTADFPSLVSALSRHARQTGKTSDPLPLARSRDLAQATAVLLIGANLTDENPLLAWNIREGVRHRGTHLYVIDSRELLLLRQSYRFLPVRKRGEGGALEWLDGKGGADQALLWRTSGGREVTPASLSDFRERLFGEADVVIVFGSAISGSIIQLIAQLGSRLGGQTRYIAAGSYNNSRGAADMGLLPHLLPGYLPVEDSESRTLFESRWGAPVPDRRGWSMPEMLSAFHEGSLDSLYVAGANPWKDRSPDELRGKGFLVVQDLFLNETAQAADVVLPAASAYEKSGTVTNTCGELQRLRKAIEIIGTRTDLEILAHLAAALGARLYPAGPDAVLNEIREVVPAYRISMAQVMTGGSASVAPSGYAAPPEPDHGDVEPSIQSVIEPTVEPNIEPIHDTLFTSGTLGRYSKTLQAVPERLTRSQPGPC